MQQLSRRRKREIIAMITAAIVGLVAYIAITAGRSTPPEACCRRASRPPRHRRRTRRSPRPPPLTATPAPAGRARFSDPQWLQVDLGASASDQPGRAAPGRRPTRTAFQIQTSADGTTWTSDLHHHDRYRRHADPQHHRHRPVRADVRHRARHRLRVLALRVPGLRHHRRRRRLRHHQRRAGPAGHRVVDWRTRRSRRPPRSTATPAPAGRAPSATRSGCRSTSAPPSRSARSC